MLAPCFATAAAPGFPAAEFGPASLAGFRPIMHRGGEGVPLACYIVLVKKVLTPLVPVPVAVRGPCRWTWRWSGPCVLQKFCMLSYNGANSYRRVSLVVSRCLVSNTRAISVHGGITTLPLPSIGKLAGNGLLMCACNSFIVAIVKYYSFVCRPALHRRAENTWEMRKV